MVDNLEEMVDQKEPFDVGKRIFACTLEMVCGKLAYVHVDHA